MIDKGGKLHWQVGFLLFTILFTWQNVWAEIAIIPVNNRLAIEILPAVQMALSKDGRATVDRIANTIIVSDRHNNIVEIKKLLLNSDQKVAMVTVRLKFQGDEIKSRKKRILSTDYPYYRGKKQTTNRTGEMFVTVASGSTGYIRLQKQVPVTDVWDKLCRQYTDGIILGKYTDVIETGMEVSPIAVGNNVIINIIPRISWQEDGEQHSISLIEAATQVTVPISTWKEIAGSTSYDDDVMRTLLTTGREENEKIFSLILKTDVRK